MTSWSGKTTLIGWLVLLMLPQPHRPNRSTCKIHAVLHITQPYDAAHIYTVAEDQFKGVVESKVYNIYIYIYCNMLMPHQVTLAPYHACSTAPVYFNVRWSLDYDWDYDCPLYRKAIIMRSLRQRGWPSWVMTVC